MELPLPSPPEGEEWIVATGTGEAAPFERPLSGTHRHGSGRAASYYIGIAMSPKEQKRNTGSLQKQTINLRKDVQEAIDRVWPDRIVEMPFDSDESYFHDVHATLSIAFTRIRHAQLVGEREAEVEAAWWDDSDPEEGLPDILEPSRSYHVFFVSPDGEAFTYETEIESMEEHEFMTEDFEEAGSGEDPPVGLAPGEGRTGWVVAVSLLAPFAVVELGDVAAFEDGSRDEAEIESYTETADGKRIDLEEQFRKMKGDEAYKILVGLREKIAGILEKWGIAVLPAEEWRKPVPWLRGGEETLMGVEDRAVRVLDAFFFEDLV